MTDPAIVEDMVIPKFLQISTLHSYSAVQLNADETGEAKKMPFGGYIRTRISSQSHKWHWRNVDDPHAIENIDPDLQSVRTRDVVPLRVIQPLRDSGLYGGEVLEAVERAFNVGVYGQHGDDRRKRQALLLGRPEVEFLQKHSSDICAAHKDDPEAAAKAAALLFRDSPDNPQRANIRALKEATRLPGGLAAALFGRMVTSSFASNVEAAIHVAHSLTTHREESESDYFSSVDDLWSLIDDGASSSYLGDTELTSPLFYGYVVVDVAGLVSNTTGCHRSEWLTADRELAATTVECLLWLIATVSPAGKRGGTAGYSRADLVLVEAGDLQPRSLSAAFRTTTTAGVLDAIALLGDRLTKLDVNYGCEETRRYLSLEDATLPGAKRLSMKNLMEWAGGAVRNGGVGR